MSSKERHRDKEKEIPSTKGDNSGKQLKRAGSSGGGTMKGERTGSGMEPQSPSPPPCSPSATTAPAVTDPSSPLERKNGSTKQKKLSFFKRSRSSSGTRSPTKSVVNGGDDAGGGGELEFGSGSGGHVAPEWGTQAALDPRAVVSDDEGSSGVGPVSSRPRDRLRRMTVKEARMEKRVKWMSSAHALPSSSSTRKQRRVNELRSHSGTKGSKDRHYDDDDDDDDDDYDDDGSVRALSVSTPDLHMDDDFTPTPSSPATTRSAVAKEVRRRTPDKLHKVVKSTATPSRNKDATKGSGGSKGVLPKEKGGEPVRYIRVGRDIKHTEKKATPAPSSPSVTRHTKRSPSAGSRSPSTKVKGGTSGSRERKRQQSRSKSPKRERSESRSRTTPKVVRSFSASNETSKTKKLRDRRTKSMEKTQRETREQDSGKTARRGAEKQQRVYHDSDDGEDDDYDGCGDDSDMNEPHTLFMELSKTASPFSARQDGGTEQDKLAVDKYNQLKRSTSNLLQAVKDCEATTEEFGGTHGKGKSQYSFLGVAKDTRSVSPRGRSRHSTKEETEKETRHPRYSESREKPSSTSSPRGTRRGESVEHKRSRRMASNNSEELAVSPISPDSSSVFYDDDIDDDIPSPHQQPTFPSSLSRQQQQQKYKRTFSPPHHSLRDRKSTGLRAGDDEDDDDGDGPAGDQDMSDLEGDTTTTRRAARGRERKPGHVTQVIERSPTSFSSSRYERTPSSGRSDRYGSQSPEKSVQSPTIKVSKPEDYYGDSRSGSPARRKPRDTPPFIPPSSNTKPSHVTPIPTGGGGTTPSSDLPKEDHLSRSGSAKKTSSHHHHHHHTATATTTPGHHHHHHAPPVDPTRLTITIPQRFSTDDESVSPHSLNSHSRSASSKSPSKSPALSPVSGATTGSSQKSCSSSVSTDGGSSPAALSSSSSRSPSPNTAAIDSQPHKHHQQQQQRPHTTGVGGSALSSGTTWLDKIHEMKIGSRKAATNRMFFPEIDTKPCVTATEALQREAAKETTDVNTEKVKKKKNVKVQRSFSERDASKRPIIPRIPEVLVKTDSMRKITRISAENIGMFGEAGRKGGYDEKAALRRCGRSSSGGRVGAGSGMLRKGDKMTSSESALEKAGEKECLLDTKVDVAEESKTKEKSKTKRWSLKGKSKDKAVEKKKELEKKKSKKEKKASRKVKKSDNVTSKNDDTYNGPPHASTQTVLLGEHLAGIKLDVEASYEEDGGTGEVRKIDKFVGGIGVGGGLSLSAVVLLKNRLARQRRLRIGFELDNEDIGSVNELRELNLLNQLVRQPLDTPLTMENEANLFKPLDIRETALVDDDTKQAVGGGGMYEKIDGSKQPKEDDPEFQAKRAQLRRESKAFRMRERRRKILSCIKKFIAFLFSHIGLCSLVVAYSIMGGFVFQAIEGPYENEKAVNITDLRVKAVIRINQLSNESKLGKQSVTKFQTLLDQELRKFELKVHNATKFDRYYSNDSNERDLKWSYASSLLYAITVMTTIGYGHVAPKTPYGRIVTIFYAVLGIPLTLLCLTNIGNLMADGFRILYGKVCCGLCCLLFKPRRYGRRKRIVHNDPELGNNDVTTMEYKVEKSNEVVQVPTSLCILLIAAYIFAGALLFSLWEKWDYLTGSYFCFITLSTIGFGDIVPGTDIKSWSQQEKLVLCALYLVIGLSLIAMCFNLVQEDVKIKCRWLGQKFGIIDRDDTGIN